MMIRTARVHVWLLVALGVVSVPRPLGGMITDGWMRGAWAEVEGRFVRGDPTGSLTISPNLAAR